MQQPSRRPPPPVLPTRDAPQAPEVVREEVFENRRGCYLFEQSRFSAKKLLPTDRPPWSNSNGGPAIDRMSFPVPAGWEWISDWAVDMGKDVDADGWSYAVSFRSRDWSGAPTPSHYVCQRKWFRLRRAVSNSVLDPSIQLILQLPTLVRSCTLDRQKVDTVRKQLELLPLSGNVLIPPYSVSAILQELEFDKSRMLVVKLLLPFLDKEGLAAALFQITHHCNRLELLTAVGSDSFLHEFLTLY